MCNTEVVIGAMSAKHHFINQRRGSLLAYPVFAIFKLRLFCHQLVSYESKPVGHYQCWCLTWFRSSADSRCSTSTDNVYVFMC